MMRPAAFIFRQAQRGMRWAVNGRIVAGILMAVLMMWSVPSAWAASPELASQTPLEQRPLVRHGAVPASQPGESQSPMGGIGFGRVLLSLAAVVGLILLMRWGGAKLFKGESGPQSTGVMQVVARAAIAPRQQLMLVRVGRRLVVVGNSGGELTALSQITDADEVAELLGQLKRGGESGAGPFASMFSRAESNYPAQRLQTGPETADQTVGDQDEASEPSPAAMQSELKGLLEKVRGMAKQFR